LGFSVTLVARREPSFDFGAQDRLHEGADRGDAGAATPAHAASRPSGLTRLVSTMQIVGSLLAVPLGLASGYSIYRANFSPETACQALRSNIVTMLDKNVDAATRRILVRRDVASFERACAAVDPDATAAFKTLLAADVATAAPKHAPKVAPKTASMPAPKVHAAVPAAEAERRVDLRPAVAEKPAVAAAAPATEAETPAPPEAAVSDTRWLAAVRQALETHAAEPEARREPARAMPPLVLQPENAATGKPAAILQPAWTVAEPPAVAPVAAEPAARAVHADADHPVPPAPIPSAPAAAPEKHDGGTFGWVGRVPLIGPVIERVRD
jgi:hypothetical protein